MNGQAGTHSSMFAAYFPGEKYTITFEPTLEQSDAITRMVTARSTSDAEPETMLQMLGIIPSEGAINPTARDAWTKKPVRAAPNSAYCAHNHLRSIHGRRNTAGKWRCRECERLQSVRKRESQKEKEAA